MKFLITGGTGFVGSYVVANLSRSGIPLTLLVRPASLQKAREKFRDLKNVDLIAGDFGFSGILQDVDEISQLSKVTDLLHLGALYDLEASETENYLTNVVGTQNLLDFSLQLKNLKNFHHVSTVAVAGSFNGNFKEDFLNVRQTFTNPYAQTKFRAESLVSSWIAPHIRKRIYRLGVVVGDSTTGQISRADGPYYLFKSLKNHPSLWKTLSSLGVLPLPFDSLALIPLIPVDLAASNLTQMVASIRQPEVNQRTYNLVGSQIPVKTILTRGLSEFGIQAKVAAAPKFLFPEKLLGFLGIPLSILDYMYTCIDFDQKNLRADYPDLKEVKFENFSEIFFRWAKNNL